MKYHCSAAVDQNDIPLVENISDLTVQGYLSLETCRDNIYLHLIENDTIC
jgi:hypothetical protein